MEKYVIMHEDIAADEMPSVCECDNGFCYEHYNTQAEAQAECDKMNARAKANGWGSSYWPAVGHPEMKYV